MDSIQSKGFDQREYNTVILAALLHDIGKFLHRKDDQTYHKISHQEAGAFFIRDSYKKLRNDKLYEIEKVEFLVRHHHSTKPKSLSDTYAQNLEENSKARLWKLLTIVKDADCYSCSERDQDEVERKKFADRKEPLKPIFLNISLGDSKAVKNENDRYHLNCLDPINGFPAEFNRLDDNEISDCIDRFQQSIPDVTEYIDFNKTLDTLVDVLQRHIWAIPSDTRYNGPDVSLFDHLRSSAAFAACLYKRHFNALNEERNFERKNEFVLIGGDYSGIQNYIFDITNRGSGGASKRLRARSFFIQLFSETTIHKILHALDLPLICNLFSAGGKFLLLAPNADFQAVSSLLEQTKLEIEEEISTTYFNQFSFLLSWMEINGYKKGLLGNNFKIDSFHATADKIFHKLEEEKLKKFKSILIRNGAAGVKEWNVDAFKSSEPYKQYEGVGECQICGKGPGSKDEEDYESGEIIRSCPICYRDKNLIGEKLPKIKYAAFGKTFSPNENDQKRIFIFRPTSKEADAEQKAGYFVDLLPKYADDPEYYLVCGLNEEVKDGAPEPIVRKHCASHVPMSSDNPAKIATFEEIASKSRWKKEREEDERYFGSDLLGVLKADIDNLGLIFSRGFIKEELELDDVDRRTVSRFLTLSRMIDLFFSGWIGKIMTAPKEEIITQLSPLDGVDGDSFYKYLQSDNIDFNHIYTVYSGGDDLLLVGPWETMIVFSIFLNMQFRKFTCNNQFITLSAGLAFVKERHPIASAIRQAEELLEKSKQKGKNKITFFNTSVNWNKLSELINFQLFLHEKVNNDDSGITSAFLYRLYEYHLMALRYLDNQEVDGLKYIPYINYDIGRNIIKRDSHGKVVKGAEEYLVIQNLINKKLNHDSILYNMKIPLFWALYKNRRAAK